jgi:hypothetical protein
VERRVETNGGGEIAKMSQYAWPSNGIRFLDIAPAVTPPATPPAIPHPLYPTRYPNRARRGPGLDLWGREEIRARG